MRTVEIAYPDDLPEALGESPEEFERELRFLVAAKLFEIGRISSGRAAELASMERVDFLNDIGRYRISPLNYSIGELEEEIRQAQTRATNSRASNM